MKWAILDTQDNLWLGTNKTGDGPQTWDDAEWGSDAELLARAAAQIVDVRAGWERGRARAVQYTDRATVVRDEVPLKDTTLNVLRKMERGAI